MADYDELLTDVESLRGRARYVETDAELIGLIEDALTQGYAEALSGEARMMRLEERLDRLLDTADERRVSEFGELVREHRAIEDGVGRLRAALAAMQRDFVAMGGARVR
jgi:hypothetical protein